MANIEVYGIKIFCDGVYTENTGIGLYTPIKTTATLLDTDNVIVNNIDNLYEGQRVFLDDGVGNTEWALIDTITRASKIVSFVNNVSNSYPIGSTLTGLSEFRFIENSLTGIEFITWSYGLLSYNSISGISESATLVRGGDLANLNSLSVNIINVDKWHNDIDTLGIGLGGLKVEIHSFVKNKDTDNVTQNLIYRGVTELSKFTEAEFILNVVPPSDARNANILTQIEDSDNKVITIPASFGSLINKKALLINTKNEQKILDVNLYNIGSRNLFPVVTVTSNTEIVLDTMQIDEPYYGENLSLLSNVLSEISNKYDKLYVKSIFGTNAGEIREINSFTYDFLSTGELNLTLTDPFPETPDTSGNDQMVCQIIGSTQRFKPDVWPIKTYLDSTGAATLGALTDFYIYDKKYKTISNYAFKKQGDGSMQISSQLQGDNFNNIEGYVIDNNNMVVGPWIDKFPDEFADYFLSGYSNVTAYPNGWFFTSNDSDSFDDFSILDNTAIGNTEDLTDNNRDTGIQYDLEGEVRVDNGNVLIQSFRISLKALDNNFNLQKAYLGIKFKSTITNSGFSEFSFSVMTKKWFSNTVNYVLEEAAKFENIGILGSIVTLNVENLPKQYYEKGTTPSNSEKFYIENNETVDGSAIFENNLTGYTLFDLGVSNVDAYNTISEIVFLVCFRNKDSSLNLPAYPFAIENKLYETCIIYETGSQDISDEVYTNMTGRIFDDTWGGRVSANNPILLPRHIMEHFCRLQNFSEELETDKNAGKEYSDEALINTGSDQGGFSHPDILALDSYSPAFQIINFRDGWVTELKKEWCKTYFCTSYVDKNGKECISYLLNSQAEISDEITIDDILFPENQGPIIYPAVRNITAQPFVRYNYDPGSTSFLGLIEITNVIKGSYASGDVIGDLSESEAEAIYNRCYNEIWKKYHVVNKPPAEVTDRYMISNKRDALDYLNNMVTWMTRKRIEIPIPYNFDGGSGTLSKFWHIGRHIKLTLPHETNSVTIECVLSSIDKIKRKNICRVNLILLDDLPTPFYLQEVFGTVADGEAQFDWVETFDTNNTEYQEVQ